MYYIKINKFAKQALYLQLANSIKAAINQGVLTHHQLLPTDEDLCKTFNISLTVVKSAYALLMKDDLIQRIQGKGTFIKTIHPLIFNINEINQIDEIQFNLGYEKEILLVEEIQDHPLILSTPKSPSSAYVRLLILGKKGLEPIFIQEILCVKKDSILIEQMISNSNKPLSAYLKNQTQGEFKSSHYLDLEELDSSNAQVLKSDSKAPAMIIISTISNKLDEVLCIRKSIYPGSNLKFVFEQIKL